MGDNYSTVDCNVQGSPLVAKVRLPELRDTEAIEQLKHELLAAVTLAKPRNIILDLGAVTFIGSVGFLVFLRVRREPGVGRIVLCNLNEQVRGAFLICRLIPDSNHSSAPFEVATSVEAALKKCGE